MRLSMLGCVLVALLTGTAGARHLTPGVAFTATLQGDASGATAIMTWHTRRSCSQFQLFGFRCLGTWECEGPGCPGRRGRLAFTFDRTRYHNVLLWLSGGALCMAQFEGVPGPTEEQPPQPPYHWRYRCFAPDHTAPIDSGTVLVELKPAL